MGGATAKAISSNASSEPINIKKTTSKTSSDAKTSANDKETKKEDKDPSITKEQNTVDFESGNMIIPNEVTADKEQKADDDTKSADETLQKSLSSCETEEEDS